MYPWGVFLGLANQPAWAKLSDAFQTSERPCLKREKRTSTKQSKTKPGVVAHIFNPTQKKEEELHEFEANLIYILSFKTVRAT